MDNKVGRAYLPDNNYQGKDVLDVMLEAKNYNKFLLENILAHIPSKESKILDFGAGNGFFATQIKSHDLTCLEIDEELAQNCKDSGLCIVNDLNQIEENSIDFIYTLNVLEHIEDDKSSLSALKSKLRQGAKLFIYVPAFQILYSKFDEQVGHFRRYDKKSLTKLLTEIGFEIEHAKYADSIGFLLGLVYKFLPQKVTKSKIIIFDRILFPIGLILDKLFCSNLFGKNVLIVAKKP